MRPSCLSQRSFGRSKGVDNHVRSAQGATSKPTAETRRSAALAPTLACIEEGAPLSIDDLAPQVGEAALQAERGVLYGQLPRNLPLRALLRVQPAPSLLAAP